MKNNNHVVLSIFLFLAISLGLNSCSDTAEATAKDKKEIGKTTAEKTVYPSDVITSFFDNFYLILGDGTNARKPINFENKDFFYTTKEAGQDWVVYKTPNAGATHGSSSNTRTELAQTKKWSPLAEAKMNATCKVVNVSTTGDARVAASYCVVIGQIHSADGHENEPLKIFYKKFPGHKKGSIFWNYEINTAGEDNGGRWDISEAVWGHDFSVIGKHKTDFPPEPKDGIELGEEISYEIAVKDGIMTVSFSSKGHESKSFTKNLIKSEYTKRSDMPQQVKDLFVPIGQDGVEVADAYTKEGLFFKLGSYNQTNGKAPEKNMVWCAGAETHRGDLQKQYADGNYAEVWFKESTISVSKDAVSNEGYFLNNDDYKKPKPIK